MFLIRIISTEMTETHQPFGQSALLLTRTDLDGLSDYMSARLVEERMGSLFSKVAGFWNPSLRIRVISFNTMANSFVFAMADWWTRNPALFKRLVEANDVLREIVSITSSVDGLVFEVSLPEGWDVQNFVDMVILYANLHESL